MRMAILFPLPMIPRPTIVLFTAMLAPLVVVLTTLTALMLALTVAMVAGLLRRALALPKAVLHVAGLVVDHAVV